MAMLNKQRVICLIFFKCPSSNGSMITKHIIISVPFVPWLGGSWLPPSSQSVRREPPHLLLSLGIAKQRPDANSICSLRNKSIGTWWSNGTWQTCKISMDMQIFPWYLVYFWKLANSHCKYHPSQIAPAFTCFETQISTHGNWTMTYYDPLRPSCEGATYNFRDRWSSDPRIRPIKTMLLLLHFSNLMPADPVSPVSSCNTLFVSQWPSVADFRTQFEMIWNDFC